MRDLFEVRWHGRGGQGAWTASELLAKAAIYEGKYIQSFPEFGPERMGAPVTAFTRISNKPIRIHCAVYEPDAVVVLDSSLVKTVP
ncbi:MAG: 2-oxoacid:acceptor oxidoreductase family protein, partial [Candidatus Bathyarchaeia archaeon]